MRRQKARYWCCICCSVYEATGQTRLNFIMREPAENWRSWPVNFVVCWICPNISETTCPSVSYKMCAEKVGSCQSSVIFYQPRVTSDNTVIFVGTAVSSNSFVYIPAFKYVKCYACCRRPFVEWNIENKMWWQCYINVESDNILV